MNPTRILVVDDHPFFRSGVIQWIGQQTTMVCCGETGSLATARQAIATLHPDIILLDLNLRDGNGLLLLPELTEAQPKSRVIVLSQAEEEVFAHRALRAGARGYVMKYEATEVLQIAIETVLRGEVYVSQRASARMLQNLFPDPTSARPELARLSDRQLQVFQLLGAGFNNRDISAMLKISPKTVETYREHLKEKLLIEDSDALICAAKRWVETGQFGPSTADRTGEKPALNR